jgi:hypothetical protein
MTPKNREAVELKDPWEDMEEEDSFWGKKPSKSSLPEIVEDEPDPESDQLAASEESSAEWDINYPPLKYSNRPQEIEARAKRREFLRVLAKTGSVKKAALAVKLTPRALYLAREKFPDFAKNWNAAQAIYLEFEAEEKLRSRAVDGVREPVYFQGNIVGYKIAYDSGVTQFWYRANMRDKYGEKSEVSISGGLNHGVALLPMTLLDVSQWEQRAKEALDRKVIDITPETGETGPPTIERR